MYTPSQGESLISDIMMESQEEGEGAPITYVFSEQENPWTVLDTGHLYRRTGEAGEGEGDQ